MEIFLRAGGSLQAHSGQQFSNCVLKRLKILEEKDRSSRGTKLFQLKPVPLFYLLDSCLDAQWCPTLCDRMDCSTPGSSVHRILQAIILVWVAIPFSSGSSRLGDRTQVSYVSCTGRWNIYHQCHLGSPLNSPVRFLKILHWVKIFEPT